METRCLTIRHGLTFPLNFSVLLSSRISELPYRTYRLAVPKGCPHQPASNTGCRWAVAGGRGGLYRDGEVRLPRRGLINQALGHLIRFYVPHSLILAGLAWCMHRNAGPYSQKSSLPSRKFTHRIQYICKKRRFFINSDICIALSTTYLSSGRILSADVTVGIQLDLTEPQRLPLELAYM